MADRAGARRGRPPKVTRALIIEAVLAEGFAGLTVPAVAKRLGVVTMTLYRHAPTRADLLAMAWGHVLDQHAWPERDLPWRDLLHRYATTLWDLLAGHPGAVTELSTVVLPERMVHLFDDLAVTLIDQGFTASDAVLAVDTVIDLAIDHRRGVEALARTVEGEGTPLQDRVGQLWALHDADTPPRRAAREAMSHAITSPPRDWFHRKLELVLDGLAPRR